MLMAYSAGAFVLEIEGQVTGYLTDAEGGEPVAPAVSEPPDANKVVRKHPGSVGYTPIQLSFGSEMELPLYQWMADMLKGTQSAKGGAIVFYDYNLIEETRIEFSGSLITRIIFPALDAASNEAALFRVTLQPELTHFSFAKAGTKGPVKSHKVKRRLLASNFRLAISDLPTNKIRRIESIIANQAVAREANTTVLQPLDISNLVFSLPQADSTPMYEWFNDFIVIGNSSKERNGTLDLLDTALSNTLFTLTLSNLGVIGVHRDTQNNGAGILTRVRVEAYVEQLTFTMVQHVSAPPATAPTVALETILEVLSIRSKEEAAHSIKSAATERATVDPKEIARRLKAAPSAVDVRSKHEAGILVGTQWAIHRASLKEVQQIADLTSREWNAVRLGQSHSLVAKLVDEGILQPPHDGPIDLARDGFTEGLTIGASRVVQRVTPVLDLSDSDVGTVVFLTLMAAAKSAREDLKAIMDSVKAINKAKEGLPDACPKCEMGEMESLRLQMAMDRLSKFMSTLSNLLKKESDTAASITQNIE